MSLRTLPWKKPPHVHELTFGEFIYLLEQDDVRLRSKALSEIFPELLGGDTPKPPPKKKVDIWRERSEEHTSELQSLMRISYAVFCLKKKKYKTKISNKQHT